MNSKIAHLIIKLRAPILIVFGVAAIISIFTISKVNINYDFTEYLAENTVTRKSLDLMQENFGSTEQISVMFENIDDAEIDRRVETINQMDHALMATHDDDKEIDGRRYSLVTATLDDLQGAYDAIYALREMYPDCTVSGTSAYTLDIQDKLAEEIPVCLLIAGAVVLLVLLATSHAWLEPLPILIVLGVSILVNMGTNWVFGTISFVTYAVCAILQLALSMDYAIMLMHAYDKKRDMGMDGIDAMEAALAESLMPIFSSALTTVAGLLSLTFMSFTIGFDIGIVLAKGIVLSMITVFLVMPALILAMKKPLKRTAHKPLPLGGKHAARFAYAARFVLPIVMIIVIGLSAYLQSKNSYIFAAGSEIEGVKRAEDIFGEANMMVLIVPHDGTDESYAKQRALIDEISEMQYENHSIVTSTQALVTTGAMLFEEYTAQEVADKFNIPKTVADIIFYAAGLGETATGEELLNAAVQMSGADSEAGKMYDLLQTARKNFESNGWERIIIKTDMPFGGNDVYDVMDKIISAIESRYDKYGIVGSSMSTYDISRAFSLDMKKVNLITAALLLVIIALAFRSVMIPVILVCVIEGAIFITMAISYVANQSIFFMSYLICIAMQMGATIDYGILLTNNYRSARRECATAREALEKAITYTLPTICTSGLILVTAGFIVGKVSSVFYISSIGLLLARGATISIILILTLLPALIALFDKSITRGKKAKDVK